jgi:hypothetical protein
VSWIGTDFETGCGGLLQDATATLAWQDAVNLAELHSIHKNVTVYVFGNVPLFTTPTSYQYDKSVARQPVDRRERRISRTSIFDWPFRAVSRTMSSSWLRRLYLLRLVCGLSMVATPTTSADRWNGSRRGMVWDVTTEGCICLLKVCHPRCVELIKHKPRIYFQYTCSQNTTNDMWGGITV